MWAKALSLAREHFTDNDPRLATSLANHAHALRQAGDEVAARRLFEDALRVWDGSGPWVAALKPERRARSSTFHLRLEAKHPGGYDGHSQERFRSLASDGRTALRALSVGAGPAFDGLARWHGEQPDGFTDGRKLLAAVCLIAAAQ